MTNNFDRCNAVTLDYEGGNDNDPRDPGGRTSRGIEQREWNTYRGAHPERGLPADVWKAPQSDIVNIYRTQYWNPMAGDQWPTGMDLCVYDAGVNSGIGKSLSWARATLGQGSGTFRILAAAAVAQKNQVALVQRYSAKRLSFLEALRTWRYFGKGWQRRVAGVESIATKWTLAAAGNSPEIVSETLTKHAAQASTKSKASGSGAVATPAAPVAHVTLVPHETWLQTTLDAVLIAGACFLIAWLVYYAYVHAIRATALAGVAK